MKLRLKRVSVEFVNIEVPDNTDPEKLLQNPDGLEWVWEWELESDSITFEVIED